jgi:homoserine O-acetyltransferase
MRDQIPYTFFEPEFAVESYLAYQGRQFIRRFDAIVICISPKPSTTSTSARITDRSTGIERTECDFLVASFSSDWLYPAYQSEELSNVLEYLDVRVEYYHVDAPFGHDSFLVEVDTMKEIVGGFLIDGADA